MSELASRDELLAASRERKPREIQVQVLGKLVRIVELGGRERDGLDLLHVKLIKERGEDRARELLSATWAVRSIVDADGKRLFTDADLDAVAGWPHRDLRRVYKVCIDLNGLADDDGDDEGN